MFTIQVYDKNTKKEDFFSRNGDYILEKCISCVTKERLNGDYELSVSYPLNDKKTVCFKKWNVIKADGQLFRIYNTKVDYINQIIEVYARHIFYDLDNYFIEDKRAVNSTVKEALERVMEQDQLYLTYDVYSDIETQNTLYFVEESPLTSIFSIIKRWGKGELIRDNFNITIRKDIEYATEYEIRYKKNMRGLTVEENTDTMVTRIYPVGYGGIKLPDKYVDVPGVNFILEDAPVSHITKKVTFDEASDVTTLKTMADEYVTKLGLPFTNIKCDLVELYDIEYYKRFKNIKKIKIGDVCTVIHDESKVNIQMKCVYIEKDLINSENTKVELGELKSILSESKPDFTDVYSQIELSKPTMYFWQNFDDITFENDFVEYFYEGVNVVSSTHLKAFICVNGVSNSESVLEMKVLLNNHELSLKPKQKLEIGDNVIGVPFAIPSVEGGQAHYISVQMKTSLGDFTVKSGNMQIYVEGVGLSGGLTSEKPHAEIIETVEYTEINHNLKDIVLSAKTQIPISINITQKSILDSENLLYLLSLIQKLENEKE